MLYKLISLEFFLRIFSSIYYISIIGSVYKNSGNTTQIGIVCFAMMIPALIISIYSGKMFISDKLTNNILFGSSLRCLILIILSFFASHLYIIFIGILLLGSLEQFIRISKSSLDSNIVDKNLRISFNSKKTFFGNIAIISGPAIGGFIASYFSFQNVFLFLSFFSFIPIIFTINLKLKSKLSENNLESNKRVIKFRENIDYLFKNKPMLTLIISYSIVIIILEMEAPLIFPFVKNYLQAPDHITGILFSLGGIGGILGALIPIYLKIKNENLVISILIVFDGIILLSFAFINSYYISMIIFMFFGILAAVSLILVETKIQNEIDEPHRPFAFSILQFSGGALGAFAAVVVSFLADIYSAANILRASAILEVFTGIILLVSTILILKKVHKLGELNNEYK